MKHPILFLLGLFFTGVYSQDRILTFASKDSINGQAQFKGSFGANIKLNGYYDVYGGLQDSETFNVGAINVLRVFFMKPPLVHLFKVPHLVGILKAPSNSLK